MGRINQIVENIYANVNLNCDSRYIFDPRNFIDEYKFKSNSRFKINGVNYVPYIIDRDFYLRLFNAVTVVPNIWKVHSWERNNLIIESDNSYVTIFDTDYIPQLLYDNQEITTNGLIAFRLGKFFDNFDFKHKIEDQLLKFLKPITLKETIYFVLPEFYNKLIECNKDSLEIILPKTGFYWKV